jgi:hypothetical protein
MCRTAEELLGQRGRELEHAPGGHPHEQVPEIRRVGCDPRERLPAFLDARVVAGPRGTRLLRLDERVRDDEAPVRRDRRLLQAQRVELDERGVAGQRAEADRLVHAAALGADVALGARAEIHELDPVGLDLVRGEDAERAGDEERRRRGESGRVGHVAVDETVDPRRIA